MKRSFLATYFFNGNLQEAHFARTSQAKNVGARPPPHVSDSIVLVRLVRAEGSQVSVEKSGAVRRSLCCGGECRTRASADINTVTVHMKTPLRHDTQRCVKAAVDIAEQADACVWSFFVCFFSLKGG